ncbi:MAG: hypothetical protein ABR608_12470 [Pseudonocardiaceae bacterium]
MISRGPSVHQTSHQLLCEALGEVLRAAVRGGPGAAGGIGSVPCRAVAALFLLLMSHPVGRRGHCRSCRRPGAMFGRRWRRCQVHADADYWLHQPDQKLLLRQLARELAPRPTLPPAAGDSRSTPIQTPAVPPSAPPRGSTRAGGLPGTAPESRHSRTFQRRVGR